MRILMLSDREAVGGAAVAAHRLAGGLLQAGMEVVRLVGRVDLQEHPCPTEVLKTSVFPSLLVKFLRRLSQESAARVNRSLVAKRLENRLHDLRPDVINVHNLHGVGWRPELVGVCARQASTVWTLHDMWSFTGSCAYSGECRGFESGCDAHCPAVGEYPVVPPKRVRGEWLLRKRLLEGASELVAVAPSRWLTREALTGLWSGHRVEVVPYGVPLELFRPGDGEAARAALGLRAGEPVILTVAHSFSEDRKGWNTLQEALTKVKARPLTLMTMGGGQVDLAGDGVHLRALGYVTEQATKSLAFAASDLLVHPARADNLPNVVLEAMACGIPCVSFAVGGLPEMVRPGETGWLAKDMTPAALGDAVQEALEAKARGTKLGHECRAVAEAEYSAEVQARRYVELFAAMMEGRQGAALPPKSGSSPQGSRPLAVRAKRRLH